MAHANHASYPGGLRSNMIVGGGGELVEVGGVDVEGGGYGDEQLDGEAVLASLDATDGGLVDAGSRGQPTLGPVATGPADGSTERLGDDLRGENNRSHARRVGVRRLGVNRLERQPVANRVSRSPYARQTYGPVPTCP